MTNMIAQPNYSAAAASFIAAPKRLLIDGEWQSSSGDKSIPVYDPSNGEEIGSVVDASIADVDRAVLAARRAFDDRRWSGLPPYEREMTIRKLADLIEANASEFAELEAIDNGKSVAAAAQMDVPGAIAQLRYMAGWATRMEGDSVEPMLAPSGAFHGYTRREPVGVVALTLLWQISRNWVPEGFVTVGASGSRWLHEEVENCLPDGWHGRLRRRSTDSFFSVPLP